MEGRDKVLPFSPRFSLSRWRDAIFFRSSLNQVLLFWFVLIRLLFSFVQGAAVLVRADQGDARGARGAGLDVSGRGGGSPGAGLDE